MVSLITMVFLLITYYLLLVGASTKTQSWGNDGASTDKPLAGQNALVPFNHYLLALTWPNSFCKLLENESIQSKRCLHSDDKNLQQFFTIHGLWPTFTNRSSVPATSCTVSAFNISNWGTQNITLANLYWPDVKKATGGTSPQSDNNKFWNYEWKKHGICSNLDTKEYMTIALDIYQRVNKGIISAIQNPRIVKTVNVNALQIKLRSLIGQAPRIVCGNLPTGAHDQYLREIQFRVNKSPPYNLINDGTSNCNTIVNFP